MALELRPYQSETVDGLWSWFSAGNDGDPVVIAPGGSGKSLMMAAWIKRAISTFPETRIILATNSTRLVTQDFNTINAFWPGAPSGIYAAKLKRREINKQILVASVNSIYRKGFDVGRCHMLLVDEAHAISRKSQSMYGKFISDLRTANHDMRMIGWTATAWRQDSGSLVEGPDAMFSDVAHEIKMADLLRDGYLAPLVSVPSDVQIDLSNVDVRKGDYAIGQLGDAVEKVIEEAIADAVERGRNRRTWMAFAPNIKNALHIRDCLRQHGISCEVITGDTPEEERETILDNLEAGRLRSVASVGCLTTGIDVPPVDMLIMLRPTKSSNLLVQMAVRGSRLSPATGKVDALFLDYAGLLREHGCIDTIEPPRAKGAAGTGEAPSKKCPECETKCRAAALECTVCGFEFPPHEVKIVKVADVAPVLSSQIKPEWVEVSDVTYGKHSKKDKPDSLVVNYHCGLARHREWICIEHSGFARTKAVQWWTKRAPGQYIPKTVGEALDMANDLPQPTAIQVRPSGKFTEIIGAKFE